MPHSNCQSQDGTDKQCIEAIPNSYDDSISFVDTTATGRGLLTRWLTAAETTVIDLGDAR